MSGHKKKDILTSGFTLHPTPKQANFLQELNGHCLVTEYVEESLSGDVRKFKSALKRYLLEGSFHNIQEYFDWNLMTNPSISY